MRRIIFQFATLRYFEGRGGVGHRLAFYFLAMVIVRNVAVVSIVLIWGIRVVQRDLTRWPGFLLRDFRWLFLGPT